MQTGEHRADPSAVVSHSEAGRIAALKIGVGRVCMWQGGSPVDRARGGARASPCPPRHTDFAVAGWTRRKTVAAQWRGGRVA